MDNRLRLLIKYIIKLVKVPKNGLGANFKNWTKEWGKVTLGIGLGYYVIILVPNNLYKINVLYM